MYYHQTFLPMLLDNRNILLSCPCTTHTRGADKSLARPGRKQATATEDFEFHVILFMGGKGALCGLRVTYPAHVCVCHSKT